MYARYRTRSKFYKRPERVLKAYNVSPNILRRPKVKDGLLHGVHADEKVDLRDKERLELLEAIRHPKERDFYQDHTYHNQWIKRDLEKHQKMQISSRYAYFAPNFQIQPWIWYPGDMVEIVSGEGIGQRGTIIAVVKYKNEILVQNINVQDVVIPASETRPEQIVQREHPIHVSRVGHIDPSTDQLTRLELVKVRNKETGEVEEKRISLDSGVLLPIPARDNVVDVGDPLRDTPIQDADEATYDAKVEMPLFVERRLQAMENYFVLTLKEAHSYHKKRQEKNAEDMLDAQIAVVDLATEKVAEYFLNGGSPAGEEAARIPTSGASADNVTGRAIGEERWAPATIGTLPAWWKEMIEPYVEELQEEEQMQLSQAEETTSRAEAERMGQADVEDVDLEFDEEANDEEGEVKR